MYVIEREQQPGPFGTMPAALWWAVVTLTTTGYGDAVPLTHLGHFIGALVMIVRHRHIRLVDRHSRHRLCRRNAAAQFHPDLGSRQQGAVLPVARPVGDHRDHPHAAALEVPERTAIIRRGKVGDCMYFIAGGEVQVDVKPTPVRLGAGAFFGELALLGDSVRTANVTTTMPSTLLILDLADFRTFDREPPRSQARHRRRRSAAHEREPAVRQRPGDAPPP